MSNQLHEVRTMIVTPRSGEIYLPAQRPRNLSFRGYTQFPGEHTAREIAENATGAQGLTILRRLGVYGLQQVAGYALQPATGVRLPRNFSIIRRELDLIRRAVAKDPDDYDEIDRQMLYDLTL